MSTPDAVLDEVREYRKAARLAVTAHAEERRRFLALLDLADAARAEPDLLVRTWCERAIWEEAKSFVGMDDELPTPPPTNYEAAQRKLGADGYDRCPTCFSSIATEADLERWHRQREQRIEQLERRERVVR